MDDATHVSRPTFMWTVGLLSAVYVGVLTIYVIPNIERGREKQTEDSTARQLLAQRTELQMDQLNVTIAKIEALAIEASQKVTVAVSAKATQCAP